MDTINTFTCFSSSTKYVLIIIIIIIFVNKAFYDIIVFL